jgi:LysR family hydrogen peroxide-inducible transcriptional activator
LQLRSLHPKENGESREKLIDFIYQPEMIRRENQRMKQRVPTLRQVQYFVAVVDLLNFRSAAEAMRVSQPTLSHQIVALEEAFGLQLFERSRAGTKLTAAGRELLPGARRLIEELQGLTDQAESLARGPA